MHETIPSLAGAPNDVFKEIKASELLCILELY